MFVALTGTPGVGKTTVARILRGRGYDVLDLNQLAEEKNFITGYDEKRDSNIVDVEELDDYIRSHNTKKDLIIEGHLSHLLSVESAIILRCDPIVLGERLKAKGWQENKIKENVAAEILDVIKIEAFEMLDKVFEIDTTRKTAEEVADSIEGIMNGKYIAPEIGWLKKYEYLLFEWS